MPDLFYIECANTLWKYVRAGLYTAAEVQADLATLKTFPLRVVSTAVSAPLLTLDGKLVRALANASYDIRSFNDFSL